MAAKIEIYTSPFCGYCHAAKRLLSTKNAGFVEIDVSRNPELRGAMMDRANGRHTVPQIFIDDQHVGGCDDLFDLERRGTLDTLLAQT